jgi:hypothetical protein
MDGTNGIPYRLLSGNIGIRSEILRSDLFHTTDSSCETIFCRQLFPGRPSLTHRGQQYRCESRLAQPLPKWLEWKIGSIPSRGSAFRQSVPGMLQDAFVIFRSLSLSPACEVADPDPGRLQPAATRVCPDSAAILNSCRRTQKPVERSGKWIFNQCFLTISWLSSGASPLWECVEESPV